MSAAFPPDAGGRAAWKPDAEAAAETAAPPLVRGVVCTHCACLCDDLSAAAAAPGSDPRGSWAVFGGCAAGRAALSAPTPAVPVSDGAKLHVAVAPSDWKPTVPAAGGGKQGRVSPGLIEAARPAAKRLGEAKHLLVYGLSRATTRTQRLAVAIADALGGAIDVDGPAVLGGVAQVGSASCTWGELRQRCDFYLTWGLDLDSHAPGFRRRFFGPENARTALSISFGARVEAAVGGAEVEDVVARAGSESAVLQVLRMLAAGRKPDAECIAAETGVELAAWERLVERLAAARYGALVWVPQRYHENPWLNEGLLDLVRALQRKTRFVAVPLGEGGNRTGAEDALAAAAGFPRAVDFRSGTPANLGNLYSAEKLLLRGEVDAVLKVGAASAAASGLSPAAADALARLPQVVVDDRLEGVPQGETWFLRAARFDGGCEGVVHRGDEVGLPLSNFRDDPAPPAEAWLEALGAALGIDSWAFAPESAPRQVVSCKPPADSASCKMMEGKR